MIAIVIVAAGAGLMVSFVKARTGSGSEARRQTSALATVQSVLGSRLSLSERRGTAPLPPQYWAGSSRGTVIAYAFPLTCRGYAGPLEILAGVDTLGTILGVAIINQSETPGIGARVVEPYRVRGRSDQTLTAEDCELPWFARQFAGLYALRPITAAQGEEWPVLSNEKRNELFDGNMITTITGATETSRAVCAAIQENLSRFLRAARKAETE
jgi:electron transport complex protein RnfG